MHSIINIMPFNVRIVAVILLAGLTIYPDPLLAEGNISGVIQPNPVLPLSPVTFEETQDTKSSFELPPLNQQILGHTPKGAKFILKDVKITGNSVFSDDELLEIIFPHLHKTVNIAQLEEMRLALTRYYTESGYVNSGALLPDQQISNGEVHFQIIEGTLKEIRITGNQRLNERYIASRLTNPHEVLNSAVLQQRFQLLLSDPLIERLNGTLHPGVQAGDSILDLKVTRARPYQLAVTLDNHKPTSVGATTLRLEGSVYNLTGWGDKVFLNLSHSQGGNAWQLAGSLPILPNNTQINFSMEQSDSEVVEGVIAETNITSEFKGSSLGLEFPIIRTLNKKLNLGITYSERESSTKIFNEDFELACGVGETGKAKTRVIRFSQEFSDRNPTGAMALRSTFNFGFDSCEPSADAGLFRDGFISWVGQARYAHLFPDSLAQLTLSATAQFSNTTLLPQERFAMGGAKTIRGYRENQLVRDNGWFISTEYIHPIPATLFNSQYGKLRIAAFIEGGRGWNDLTGSVKNTLSSVGVGLLWKHGPISAELYAAKALQKIIGADGHDLQDDGIHFRIKAQVF